MENIKKDKHFIEKIETISNQKINDCYQCGRCTAGCPFAEFMDEPPNRVIRMIQLGMKQDVLSTQGPWLCAACLVCQARCPRGVDIPRLMEAVRTVHLRAKEQILDIDKIDKELLKDAHPLVLMSAMYKFSY